METIAKAKMIRIAPRKTRLVINLIRGKNVNDALAILDNQNQKAENIDIVVIVWQHIYDDCGNGSP